MKKLTIKTHQAVVPAATLTLPWALRIKSRLRVVLDNGDAAGIFLARGQMLRNRDIISTADGFHVEVVAAPEKVSTACADSARTLNLACYHLGNRHVDLEIGEGFVRYRHDHVLDEMIMGLGLTVTVDRLPFEPEAGAYGRGHHH